MTTHLPIRLRPRMAFLAIVLVTGGCATAPPVGESAPAFAAPDTAGRNVASTDYDQCVLLMDFWATWCSPCRKSSPAMQALHEQFAADDRVHVLAIHYDDKGDPAAYMAKHGYTYRNIPSGGAIARAYGVTKIPTFIVVDTDGRIAHRQIGYAPGDEERLAQIIETALATAD